MISITSSRFKLLLAILSIFLIWQTLKFFPWLRSFQPTEITHGPAQSSFVAPVLVTVFYEALCPDSKNFIVKQLLPSMEKASRLLNVTLVPYGKAKTVENSNGSISFNCQHGPTECLANKIHSCAISKISYSVLQIAYISCMISDNMVPELIGEKCAKDLGIEWKSILQCTNSQKGNFLLKEYGKLTDTLDPKMTFVPTILLDNKQNNQAAILKDFFSQVCKLFPELPEECSTSQT